MNRFYPKFVPEFPYEPSPEKFKIGRISKAVGSGVISKAAFKKGEIVFGFTGFTIDFITQFSLQYGKNMNIHDPFFMGKVLHSCDPNTSCDMQRRIFIARRDIHPGELVTMDYEQTEDVLFKPFLCQCGAGNCRKIIQGKAMVADAMRKSMRKVA